MSLNLNVPTTPTDLKPRIVVLGVGGAGGNAVNNMIKCKLEGVDCVVANTDAQALTMSLAERKIQLGRNITQGLGAGSRPDIGRAAAEEGIEEILDHLQGVHMVFLTAGMGGGTGTGAAPVIARAARDQGILTVGVVTKPFHFEGPNRMRIAEAGLLELQQYVDTLIIIPNQNLFRVATEKTTFADAFKMADDVLHAGVRGVTDLMVMPGLINLDFADIRTVMSEMGKAMMGAGESEGQERAREAAEAAINNPLLDDVSMKGARGVLVNITGGPDMTLYEVDEAVNRIRDEVDANANLIFGSTFAEELEGGMRVSIFATGIEADAAAAPQPTNIRLVAEATGRAAPAETAGGESPATATQPPVTAATETGDDAEDNAEDSADKAKHGNAEAVGTTDAEVTDAGVTDAFDHPLDWRLDDLPAEAIEPAAETHAMPAAMAETSPAAEPTPMFSSAREAIRVMRENLRRQEAKEAEPGTPPRDTDTTDAGDFPVHARATTSGENSRESAPSPRDPGLFEAVSGDDIDARGRQEAPSGAPKTSEDWGDGVHRGEAVHGAGPFSGLDPADRLATSQSQDDLLEIPAFLRRQAN